MNPEALFQVKNLDIRKLNKACNYPSCARLPTKQATVIEISSRGKKELADIYFCDEHYGKNMLNIMRQLSPKCKSGTFIEKKVLDIGYMTY